VIRLAATCICGSDLWPWPGANPIAGPTPIGHEYCGLVEEVGSGQVFDLTLPLDQVAEGYRAMDERRAIKTLLRP
jgi:threonine dehydrogenase-like Zn-dependent dehydrogenase